MHLPESTYLWALFIAGHGLHVLKRASLSAQSRISGTKSRLEWLRTNALNLAIRLFVNAAGFSYWIAHPNAEDARHDLAVFAELERAPEHIHTYRLTSLSLWNAAAPGMTAEAMIGVLTKYSKFPLQPNLPVDLRDRREQRRPILQDTCQDRLRTSLLSGHRGERRPRCRPEMTVEANRVKTWC